MLLVHAEDQMMAAELIHDLTKTLVQTEKRIAQLEEKLKR
nr:PTS lactose/cellobiose transporter subunit IIA [Liquorilactobacillus vini]